VAIISKCHSFARDQRGVIAPLFAIVLVLIVGSVGFAVDGARWYAAVRQTNHAVDAAVLAAARMMQLEPDNPEKALATGKETYLANTKSRPAVVNDTVAFAVAADGRSIGVSGNATLQPMFLPVLGIDKLTLLSNAKAKASFQATGLNEGTNLEISLMLDFTGSMCDDGQGPCTTGTKVEGLRQAATDLVNIVIQADQSIYTQRIAIVPFSTRVRVDVDNHDGVLMKKLTNLDLKWGGWYNDCASGSGNNGGETIGNWQCVRYVPKQVVNWRLLPCVTERAYDAPSGAFADSKLDYTDKPPGPGAWMNGHDGTREVKYRDSSDDVATQIYGLTANTASSTWNYEPLAAATCADSNEANRIIPLSSDKQLLIDRIAQFTAAGATAGAGATSWSWYMISPNWDKIWTGTTTPGPYSDLTAKQDNGAPVLRKVAVLMTDGVYNTIRYSKGESAVIISDHAKQICTAMKAEGIEIFTVGFALDEISNADKATAEDVLKSCGTDISHFYPTLTVPELKAAFRDIALKVSPVRLTE
jgi:Flp pilus assembly protein TadG